jgi:hypothetical protein
MKLSEETIVEGRKLVAAGNIDILMPWVREHAPVGLDHAIYERTMHKCFIAEDVMKAMKLHNAVFDTYDADEERRGIQIRSLGCGLVLAVAGALVVSIIALAIILVRLVVR